MNRCCYLFALWLLSAAWVSTAGDVPVTASRPDILLIMPDQMRGDCLSMLGHPVVRTPHLDQLAREGMLFRRAYSTCPSCIPARHSLLTGLFPSTSGVVGFAARPIPYPTLPQVLDKAGYRTVLVGRCMHQLPKDESYGFQQEIKATAYVADDDYDQFLKQVAPETGGLQKLMQTLGVTFNGWEAKPWPLKPELHPVVWIFDQARKTLKETSTGQPIFLTASFFAPHPPLFPPPEYWDMYAKQKLPAPAHGDWVNWATLSPRGNPQGDRVLLEGEALHAAQAGYFGLISLLDEQTAQLVVDFTTRSRKAGHPWVILFTTDHGEMLGDHGYFRKCEPFEGSANIPFIVVGSPELGFKAGLTSSQPICLEDIMPTLLELAGAPIPDPMDGVSLLPALRGQKQTIRQILHFEHATCYNKPQAFQALTDGRFKYIWRPLDGSEQLFDLLQDPQEEHDLARQDSQQKKLEQWRQRMIKVLAGRPEGFTDGKKLIPGRPYPPLQARSR